MGKNNCFANKNTCSGCGACYSICPVSAIAFELNQKGFYEASIDKNKCISCGKCVEVCPKYIKEENQIDRKDFSVFSFIHNNKNILKDSSSGAFAWALIEIALSQGYKICGVEYDYYSNTAKAFFTKDLIQAQKSKGSKYLQADTRIYKDILKEKGKFIVLGTPCQIAGLAKAATLNNRREDFLLVDCFCHGVPSYLIWKKFLKHIGIEQPKEVNFRSKKGGWHNYYMEIFGDNRKYCADARTNPFYKLFFSDLLLNNTCYSCKVKSATFADIRIGDFWGSEYDLTEKGVSIVLPLSDFGKKWLDLMQDKGSLKNIDYLRSKIIKSQSAFKDTPLNKEKREDLFFILENHDLAKVLSCYEKRQSLRKKIITRAKAIMPLCIAKYLRFIAHKVRGY